MKHARTATRQAWPVLVISVLALSLPVHAQEDDAEETGRTRHLFAEVEGFGADPSGLGFFPASRLALSNAVQASLIEQDPGGSLGFRYRFGFQLGKSGSALVGTWFAHEADSYRRESLPSQFVFGEQLAYPYLAGFENDGFADGYESTAGAVLRDLRVDYYHPAFRGPHVEARWFIGVRSVSLQRSLDATYLATGALLPPFDEPRPNLVPNADSAGLRSEYSGRGFEGGLELRIPLLKDKLWIESGLLASVMRGKVDADYYSINWYYSNESGQVINPPYSITLAEPFAEGASQSAVPGFLSIENQSMASSILELSLGARWRVLEWLELSVGARMADYANVGVDLRPEPSLINSIVIRETERSANYEGVYTGVALRF